MSEIALPHGYTEEDIARGFTTGPGRTPGVAEKKAIPADILLVVELRHLRALLERWPAPHTIVTNNAAPHPLAAALPHQTIGEIETEARNRARRALAKG